MQVFSICALQSAAQAFLQQKTKPKPTNTQTNTQKWTKQKHLLIVLRVGDIQDPGAPSSYVFFGVILGPQGNQHRP